MIRPALLLASALALLPAATHAEKWTWFPIPGGALGYDDDSRRADIATGHVAGDTLVYYFVPRALEAESYSFLIRRVEFDCRAGRYQPLEAAFFNAEGEPLGQAAGGEWTAIAGTGPMSAFKRIFCDNDRPPTAKAVKDKDALVAALRALPPTSEQRGQPAPPAKK